MGEMDLRSEIKWVLDSEGITGAIKHLEDFKKGEQEAKEAGSALSEVARDVGKELAAFGAGVFAGAKIVEFFKDVIGEAQRVRAATMALQATMQNLGIDVGAARGRVEEITEELKRLAGVDDDEVIPALQKMLGLTGNLEAAMDALRIAALLSRQGFGTVQENVERLASIMQGRMNLALREYGIASKNANGEALTTAEALRKVADLAEVNKEKIEGSTPGWIRLKAAWADFKQVGELLLPVWSGLLELVSAVVNVINFAAGVVVNSFRVIRVSVDGILGSLNGLYTLLTEGSFEAGWKRFGDDITETHGKIAAFVGMGDKATESTGRLGDALVKSKKSAADFAEDMRGAKDALKSFNDEADRLYREQFERGSYERMREELKALDKWYAEQKEKFKGHEDVLLALDRDYAAKRKALLDEFSKAFAKHAAEDADEQRKIEDKKLQAIGDAWQRQRKQLEHEMEEQAKLLEREYHRQQEAKVRSIREGARSQKVADEAEIKGADAKIKHIEALGRGASVAQLRELEVLLRRKEKLEEDSIKHRLKAEIKLRKALGEDTAELEKALDDELAANHEQYGTAIEKIERAIHDGKIENWQDAANVASEIQASFFANNKALALATAAMQGAVAVVNGFATEPFIPAGLLAGALAIAKTAAQIRTIESTSFSRKGFDDPVNDRAAYVGGQKWGSDMVSYFRDGLSAGWASGISAQITRMPMGGSSHTTVNNSRSGDTYLVSVRDSLLDQRRTEQRLEISLREAKRRNRGRYIGGA